MFDVRDPTEYAAGHLPGAVNAPGGQLVQATDQYVGTLGARIVLVDDREVRAVMTASWLKQMGWRDVFVLIGGGNERVRPMPPVLGPPVPSRTGHRSPGAVAAGRRQPRHRGRSVAQPRLPQGPHSRRVVRDPHAAAAGAGENPDERRTGADVGGRHSRRPRGPRMQRYQRVSARRQRRLAGGRPRFSTEARMADEPLDYWPKPYERSGDTKGAMNEYLSWEIDLLPRIERDGTTRFAIDVCIGKRVYLHDLLPASTGTRQSRKVSEARRVDRRDRVLVAGARALIPTEALADRDLCIAIGA